MTNIRKFIAAVVGLALMLINQFWGYDLFGFETQLVDTISGIIGVITAATVYQLPNTPKA